MGLEGRQRVLALQADLVLPGTSAGMRVAPEYSLDMAGSVANSARTRVVLSRERASSRASTERASTRASTEPRFAHGTNPPPVSDEPYLKLEITSEISSDRDVPLAEGTGRAPRYVRTVSRRGPASRDSAPELEPHMVVRGVSDGEIETNPLERQLELETNELPRVSMAEIEESTREVERVLDTFVEPSLPTPSLRKKRRALTDSARRMWLGVVLSAPEVGASLVIGTWLRPDFCVTSPALRVVEKKRGVLVQTLNHRYFVKPEGDTYLITDG